MANSHVQGLSLRTRVHVMTLARINAGINKAQAVGATHGKSGSPIGRSVSFLRRWSAISNVVAESDKRPCQTNAGNI